jgi:mycothiol synthase
MQLDIHAYQPADAPDLMTIWAVEPPVEPLTAPALERWLAAMVADGGRGWLARQDSRAVAFGWTERVPGLPGVLSLNGFVANARRRQGIGGALLARIVAETGPGHQLSYPVTHLASPVARFLGQNGFTLEHSELRLLLTDPPDLDAPALPAGLSLVTHSGDRAARLFRQLYQASFAGHPWYQPYDDEREIWSELRAIGGEPADILFLRLNNQYIAFAWLRQPEPNVGEIEPIGVVSAAQGQGYGRLLLAHAIQRLIQRGARQVRLGVWADNAAAIALYERAGFRPVSSLHYLARDL